MWQLTGIQVHCTACPGLWFAAAAREVFSPPRHWHYSNSKLERYPLGCEDKTGPCPCHGPRDIEPAQAMEVEIGQRHRDLKRVPLLGRGGSDNGTTAIVAWVSNNRPG